jgi:hypothetical protein
MSISNVKLEEICKKKGIPLNGVYMKDELAEIQPQEGNYIINLQSSYQGSGTHWLALIIERGSIYYQDSFGVIYPLEILVFIHKYEKLNKVKCKIGHNKTQIQDLKSDRCGYFCLGLLYFVKCHKDEPLFDACNEYINMFSDNDLKGNDTILMKYIKA